MSQPVYVSDHPLVLHKLAQLRDIKTEPPEFRQLVKELAQVLFLEAGRELPTRKRQVQTPLADCDGRQIKGPVGLVPILRAGLGMAEAIQDLLPLAQVWHLGLYRDHKTLKPVTYYNKLPKTSKIDICFVVDPMLATGGSAVAVLDILKRWGVKKCVFLGLIAAPEGVEAVKKSHPDVSIYLAAIDSHLNENSYIVPGLGDAGDRQFGTIMDG